MTSLITILISILGYGSPADYTNYTQEQLQNKIETTQSMDGGFEDWDQ